MARALTPQDAHVIMNSLVRQARPDERQPIRSDPIRSDPKTGTDPAL